MFFLTTAIDYTNGKPHLGHAYEKVLADSIARHRRLRGEEVFFLTGVDQHGQKVQQSARKEGTEPAEFVGAVTALFLDLWKDLGISYDRWAATTDPVHVRCVQAVLQRLHDSGQFYKARSAGFYSVQQEQFLTDKERGPDGAFGPEWGEVVFVEEENYFFKLAEHRDWLLALIDKSVGRGRPLVLPGFRLAELRNAAEKISGDLCISRPKSRLEWGIELPFDRDFVTYVWFDALTNYISFAGFHDDAERFAALWPALHVIGKDILAPPHGIYWPVMLKACGIPDDLMPTLLVHGWWNIGGAKMSKSLGNVVDPAELLRKYGANALRYYLLADIATGRDADFNEDRFLARYNGDLANTLGNLLNRSLSMAARYRGGRLKLPSSPGPLEAAAAAATTAWDASFEAHEPHSAIQAVLELLGRANARVEETAPWKLAKDPAKAQELDDVLYSLAETLRIASILMEPVIPQAAAALRLQLAWEGPATFAATQWGGLKEGHSLGAPTPLFPRYEIPE